MLELVEFGDGDCVGLVALGTLEGACVVGEFEGAVVWAFVGGEVGAPVVGDTVGAFVGARVVGGLVGAAVGAFVGAVVGAPVGWLVAEGAEVGEATHAESVQKFSFQTKSIELTQNFANIIGRYVLCLWENVIREGVVSHDVIGGGQRSWTWQIDIGNWIIIHRVKPSCCRGIDQPKSNKHMVDSRILWSIL
jgi:hypothetical protein